ncbi:MAG: hypothetical protein EB127_06365 [Alphaproteobacteria bacterium]|nr:hypothetical protein [Alphaproteobacteria bacterium]
MIQIKKFLDKVSYLESRKSKDCILPLNDARLLRDEIAKLLTDLYALSKDNKQAEVFELEIKGGTFK